MKKYGLREILISSIAVLLPIVAGFIIWDKLPETMATHFGVGGEADGYASKLFTVVGVPLILLVLHLFCLFITSLDPKAKNQNKKIAYLVLWLAPIISIATMTMLYTYNVGIATSPEVYTLVFVGALFLILGNWLPKTRQNYAVGIKVPWTLDNELNWEKTHRLAGYLWMIGGIIMIIVGITTKAPEIVVIVSIFIVVVIPILYSYYLHAKKGL
ncbi:SdpI family protein [Butyrivibrio sp. INlla21]|uniref:SdpI family protein n=1 Tax=Butyrivibrio sp. INlla21 TaxID=1520811 RepID=UPI0008ECCCEC|nr:SdpI family protein [Butyrivibrio sp. INlla21]SFU97070.1 Uncharacterized membrane protein [Butyrivibrio sp. INlla21]